MLIGVTGIGGLSAGGRFEGFHSPIQGDQVALSRQDALASLPDSRAGVAEKSGFKKHLKSRKAAKLLTSAARLGLSAAAMALGDVSQREDMGLFVGVGREPPDEGDAETTLVLSERDGRLDLDQLAGTGRDAYPPLLPLKTLPNMILAHISIHLNVMGCNGVWAGGPEAGVEALMSAFWAIREARCKVALAGAADSLIDLGQTRDLYRLGMHDPPGEGSVFLKIERLDPNQKAPWTVEWTGEQGVVSSLSQQIGYCGASDALLHLAQLFSLKQPFCFHGLRFLPGLL